MIKIKAAELMTANVCSVAMIKNVDGYRKARNYRRSFLRLYIFFLIWHMLLPALSR